METDLPRDCTVVLVNPPLDLPRPHIDNPAFAFYAARCAHARLADLYPGLAYVDAFLEGGINRRNGHFRLGADPERLMAAIRARSPGLVLICYTGFLRAQGLDNPGMAALIQALESARIPVSLLDLYDSTTHYLDFDEQRLQALFPHIRGVYKKYVPAEEGTPPRFPLDTAPLYRNFLDQAARHGLIKDHHPSHGPVFPFQTSFGCPHRCLFCKSRGETRTGLPAEQVLGAFSWLREAGYSRIYITDPYANHDPGNFKAVLAGCPDLGLTLHFTNGLGLAHLDAETAALLPAVADCLYLSPESLWDEDLETLRKPFNSRTIRDKIGLVRENGLPVHCHFILGLPDHTRRDIVRRLDEIAAFARETGIVPRLQVFTPRQDLMVREPLLDNIYARFFPAHTPDPWMRSAFRAFQYKTDLRGKEKIIINLSYRCNNRCRFCAVGDRARTDGDHLRQIQWTREARQQGVRLLDLDGGEPLLYPRLFDIIDAARDYDRVTVTTNGRMLAYGALARKLASRENLDLLISLHGADESVHDALTRAPGSFRQTLQGIRNAVRFGMNPGVNTTVTADNWRQLPDIASTLTAMGITRFNIQWYTPFGEPGPDLEPPEAAVHAVRDLITCHGTGLTVSLINFRYCQAPDLTDHMAPDYYKAQRHMYFVNGERVNLSAYLAGRRQYRPGCDGCAYRIICGGYWDYGGRKEAAAAGTMLDIIPGYGCNIRCRYCTATPAMRKVNPGYDALIRRIDPLIRCHAPARARIGGGEPTIRKDLFRLVAHLKTCGIPEIAIQTNGLMTAYPHYLERLVRAGVSRINISLAAWDESSLARLTGLDGMLARVRTAVANICRADLPLEMDVLLTRPGLDRLAAMVADLAAMGVTRFNFWHMAVPPDPAALDLVPDMGAAARQLVRLFDTYPRLTLRAYYIPYCFFPQHGRHVWHPLSENALVVTPERTFPLDQGTLELGVKTDRCRGCARFGDCFGIREDYLKHFGDAELTPL